MNATDLANSNLPKIDWVHLLLNGGIFLWILLFLSFLSLTIIFYKFFSISKSRILPERLVAELESLKKEKVFHREDWYQIQDSYANTVLGRICGIALSTDPHHMKDEVEAMAKNEVVKMHSGMVLLEIIMTIAPLLGLLGTVSGLVLVFTHFDSAHNIDMIARGIGRALHTTIGGLVVALPALVAHGYFHRRIEKMTMHLEILMVSFVNALASQR